MERVLRVTVQRVPVVDPRRRVALVDRPLTEDTDGALLLIHHLAEFSLVELIESRPSMYRALSWGWKGREIVGFGVDQGSRVLTIWRNVRGRPRLRDTAHPSASTP